MVDNVLAELDVLTADQVLCYLTLYRVELRGPGSLDAHPAVQ